MPRKAKSTKDESVVAPEEKAAKTTKTTKKRTTSAKKDAEEIPKKTTRKRTTKAAKVEEEDAAPMKTTRKRATKKADAGLEETPKKTTRKRSAASEAKTEDEKEPAPKKTTRKRTTKKAKEAKAEAEIEAQIENALSENSSDANATEDLEEKPKRVARKTSTTKSKTATKTTAKRTTRRKAAASVESETPAASDDQASAEYKEETHAQPGSADETPSEGQKVQQTEQAHKSQNSQQLEQSATNSQDIQHTTDAEQTQGAPNGKRKFRRRNQKRDAYHFMSREELLELDAEELLERAQELQIEVQEIASMTKDQFIDHLYNKAFEAQGCSIAKGVLDIMTDGYGFLRSSTYLPGENDTYVNASFIRRYGLRKGDYIEGVVRAIRETEKFAPIQTIDKVNGINPAESKARVKFAKLTPIYPDDRLVLEHGKNSITGRMIDLVSPIGKGQRGLIVSPPKAGKTTVLKDIAAAITANNPEVKLMCLLIDERPEEVTDMERSIKGEVISSTFDMPCEHHITVAELVIERAKRLVELGHDVVILLDSLTRLARAYNLSQPASGRVLSGGVDSTALYPPKKFLGAARNIEDGGSLTILASALIDTGSKMDEVIFEEFKGTGNMELKLDRYLADRRIFPAIDAVASGTRKEDLLIDPQEAPLIWAVRRLLANMNNTERATNMLISSLKKTESNTEFLLRAAKKAQTKGKLEEL